MLLVRCDWASGDPLMEAYHDTEWGVPCHDDRKLFELLMLDCFQAGLSWSIILRKRTNFARAFDGWDARAIAAYGPDVVERLLADAGIVRNRVKVNAAIGNARAFLEIQRQEGSFDTYVWRFVGEKALRRSPPPGALSDLPSRSEESDALSRDLARHGFRFVGSTTCYAFMQSAGLVNDHLTTCFRAPVAERNSLQALLGEHQS